MFGALERIDFQINSKLSTRLIDLCQTAIDYGNEHLNSSNITDRIAFAKTMKTYLTRTFNPALKALIKEEINLTIREINVHNDYSFYMIPVFEFVPKTRTGYIAIDDTAATFSGTRASEKRSKYKLEDFLKLKDSVDLSIGKIKGKVPYAIDLGFGLWFFALSKLYPGKAGQKYVPFTARNMAAIFLHEIGHGMTILEHTADGYYKADMLSQTIKDLKKKPLDEQLKILEPIVTSDSIEPKYKKILVNMSKKIAAARSEDNHKKNLFIEALINMFISGIVYVIFLGMASSVNSDTKSSDTVVSLKNNSFVERIADEFVARHGLGGDLADGLNKYGILFGDPTATSIPMGEVFAEFGIFMAIIAKLEAINSIFMYPMRYAITIYDPYITRIKEMILATTVALKDKDISTDTRKEILKQIDMAEKVLKDYRKAHNLLITFWDVFLKVSNYRTLPLAIANANLAADYAYLEKETDGLIRNPLYITAARIKEFY